jgi:hypothetical protein
VILFVFAPSSQVEWSDETNLASLIEPFDRISGCDRRLFDNQRIGRRRRRNVERDGDNCCADRNERHRRHDRNIQLYDEHYERFHFGDRGFGRYRFVVDGRLRLRGTANDDVRRFDPVLRSG